MSFFYDFLIKLFLSLFNHYGNENWDHDRFPDNQINNIRARLSWLFFIAGNIPGFNRFYLLLNDKPSQDMMVLLLLYRILGYKKVRLTTNTPDYWVEREAVADLIVPDDLSVQSCHWALSLFDLNSIGYPLSVQSLNIGIHTTFLLRHYEHKIDQRDSVKAEEGDYVIDAGGCWGDTALFFANSVYPTGQVYSFEFVDQNIQVFKKNLEMNPDLAKLIEIVPHPLFSQSDLSLYYNSQGPASRVSENRLSEHDTEIRTITIDDFVTLNRIPKIDFIKMDIEGAELDALKGAMNTIKQYHPKLAISLYHKRSDFIEIPAFISGLGAPYKYFLGTIQFTLKKRFSFALVQVMGRAFLC